MLAKIICKLISIYQQTLRIILPVACRFSPSCSEYTKEAILKYGLLQGGLKGLKRIFSCHPLSGKNGFDPLI
ncbi:MAG: membrane protein insertion efficiency factor YidD [Candidatus Omnitrophica bacterium]|nr:membrane protein insertion efficiency factor YidD [Candidatus Omnitrophota bacterium]MBU1090768.1 membrane protein insertion efficiency factor YidD [Candidatus Omnitrophota bacterium]MBU1906329.1 membrane protein insertion efficiency factor YidD [Candidatus Omnitrophota bacterium]